jgi:hypothetical protein
MTFRIIVFVVGEMEQCLHCCVINAFAKAQRG